jgi:hypothetical protein
MTVNDALGGAQEKAVAAFFNVLSEYLAERTEKKNKNMKNYQEQDYKSRTSEYIARKLTT